MRPSSFRPCLTISPCLPVPAKSPPRELDWIHEIKHDGFRILAHRHGGHVRLLTRNGYDLSDRFTLATAAIVALPVRSCIIDGEAIACDQRGLSVFDMIRWRRHDHAVLLCAFDLIELNSEDLRHKPIEERKRALAQLLRRPHDGIAFNQHFEGAGGIISEQACALGCEGIVSKRRGSPYRSGRVNDWLKIKNPAAPAVTREAE